MSLDPDDPRLAPHLARLQPYARGLVARAAEHALRLHADAVTPEHLLSTLMEDPRTAAHAAVLHAFADPATIAEEALAISPGLMVVASGSTLAFSPRAAEALARADADAEGREVDVARILAAAASVLDEDLRRALREAGFSAAIPEASGTATALAPGLFHRFSTAGKRVLSASNRLAAGERATSISHVHLFLACLQEDPALADRVGLGFRRARMLLAARSRDDSAVRPRALPADPSLIAFLEGVPPGSDSLSLLARFAGGGTPELAQILVRSKVTAALLERARNAFQDPAGQPDQPAPRRSRDAEL
jgi:hypothetical protein